MLRRGGDDTRSSILMRSLVIDWLVTVIGLSHVVFDTRYFNYLCTKGLRQDKPASTCIFKTQELNSTCIHLHIQSGNSATTLWNRAMTGKQGKATPVHVLNFIARAVTEDPKRTSAVIKGMLNKEFGSSPDLSTITRHRKKLGLPSSRTDVPPSNVTS